MVEIAELSRLNMDAIKGMTLVDITNDETKRAARMNHLFEKGGETFDLTADEAGEIMNLNDELTALAKARESRDEYQAMQAKNTERQRHLTQPAQGHTQPTGGGKSDDAPPPFETVGRRFVKSQAFTAYDQSRKWSPAIEMELGADGLKTLLTTTGAPLRPARTDTSFGFGPIVPGALRRPVVADLIPQGTTNQNAIIYLEETTTTNAGAFVAEGADKPESALAFTERTAPVRKIATVLPVTDELMDDEPAMESYLDARLGVFLALAEEAALLTGTNNTAPNFAGLYNVSGIQTQAKGADATPDAFYKAIVKVQTVGFLPPSGVVMHPNDWQDIRLLKTADGVYIWGSPADAGPERIWGLPVVSTTAATENTGIVAAFDTAMQIFRRTGVQMAVSDSHSDFFIKNQLMLRIEERLAFAVYRPTGVCTVTGI